MSTRREFLFGALATIALAEIACGPRATPTPTRRPSAKPTAVPPVPQLPRGIEIAAGVPDPADIKQVVPTPMSRELLFMENLIRIGVRATELARTYPEYFIDLVNTERTLDKLWNSGELIPNTAVPPYSFSMYSTIGNDQFGNYAKPRSQINLHPSLFTFPVDDQVLAITEAILVRDIHTKAMQNMVGRPPLPDRAQELHSYIIVEKSIQAAKVYFDVCELLAGMKEIKPNYKSDTRRLVYERQLFNNGQDSLYSIYKKVMADPDEQKRNEQHPAWRKAISESGLDK